MNEQELKQLIDHVTANRSFTDILLVLAERAKERAEEFARNDSETDSEWGYRRIQTELIKVAEKAKKEMV